MSVRNPALRRRAMLAFGMLGVIVSALVVGVCLAVNREALVSGRERSAERQTFLNARAVRTALSEAPAGRAVALESAQTSREGVALLVAGSDWYSTSVSIGPDDLPDGLLQASDAGGAGRQRVEVGGEPMVAVAVPIAEPGATYVELVPLRDVEAAMRTLTWSLLAAGAASALVAVAAGWLVSVRMLRPLRRMARAADEIREGTLDRRLGHDDDADLEPLVRSFNGMVEALEERIEREARFASDVSHELRSPLATMSAALSVARRRADDPAVHDALDLLDGEVGRFTELIDQLLEIGRAEAGVAQLVLDPVDPMRFTEAVVAAGRHDVPIVAAAGAGERAHLDKRRMAQVITNLLENAAHHGGGATRVTVDGTPLQLTFSIDDAGPGVAEHERTHVFGRFARGRQADAPGTGLGLALVREHFRLHGGDVAIATSIDGGARFTVTIPRGGAE